MKLEEAKSEFAALYSKKTPLSLEERVRRVQLACTLSTHYSENFKKMLEFIKKCGECHSNELEDFVISHIAGVIDDAEEVEGI